jgi:hypothetical protein
VLHWDNLHWQRVSQILRNEHESPLRLLVTSYGLAAVVSVLVALAGVGIWVSLLVFWLGGTATVFAVGLIATTRKPNNARMDQTVAGVGAIYSLPDRAVDFAISPDQDDHL